ncbi:MAG: response regulator [Proteobacteria bacterium]|jgi:DNA-binding NtrC family response regulator|nr:response regulator [Pseudomonadota bacterium]
MPKTILFIEDNQDYRETLADLLSDSFDCVLTAANGSEALNIAKSEHIDIILSDVSMPEMRGDDFLTRLRAIGKTTPIVFLTGNADKDLAVSVLRLGAADVIDKPAQYSTIRECLEQVIEINRRESALHHAKTEAEAEKEKKMLGLLRVVNDRKRKSS